MNSQQASNSTAAAMLPTFTWVYIIVAGMIQSKGEVVATDVYDALEQTLYSSHLDQETYGGALGVRPEELRGALNLDPDAVEQVLEVPNGTLTLKKKVTLYIGDRLRAMTDYLRQEHRLKVSIDYAYTLKYEKLNILCASVYEDLIRDACNKHLIEIASTHTYD